MNTNTDPRIIANAYRLTSPSGRSTLTEDDEFAHEMEVRGWTATRLVPAPAIPAQQAGDMVMVPRVPTHAMLAALTQEWHASRHGKARDRYAAMLAAAPAIPAQQAGQPEAKPRPLSKEVLTEKLVELLHDTYHCKRVWYAWQVGTMSEDDFVPVPESDTPTEIADEMMALLASHTPQAGQPEDAKDAALARMRQALGNYMSAFGQALEAHGIPMGPQQVQADAEARAAMSSPTAKKGEA